jgi:hypothetical protein
MPLKFRNNLSNTTNPNIMIFDERRRRQRNEKNFSLKIEKLYGSTEPAPPPVAFWTFDTPAGGEEIEAIATFTGFVKIFWGDDDTDILVSEVPTSHTYS